MSKRIFLVFFLTWFLFIASPSIVSAKVSLNPFANIKSLLLFSFFKVKEVNIKIPPLPITAPVTASPSLEITPKPTKRLVLEVPKNEVLGAEVETDNNSPMLGQVNAIRISAGLTKVNENKETCEFAEKRAQEIAMNFDHLGFEERYNQGTLPYSHFSKVVENIAMNGNSSNVVPSWSRSAVHLSNMKEDIAFACIRNSGKYYVLEGLNP